MKVPQKDECSRNVFRSLRDFFDPDQHAPAPLVLLPPPLNPFPAEERVQIFAKLMYLSPTLNLKWSPAFQMLRRAMDSGGAQEVHRVVEASSGNMALALALQCRAFGLSGVDSFVPADLAFVKKELLYLAGVHLDLCTDVPGQPSAIEKARSQGDEPGFVNLGQYENPGNPEAHARWTAPGIWEQTQGALTVFCGGMGTTGTLVGARNAFEALSAKVEVVGCLCAPGSAVPGLRTEARLAEIRFDWQGGIHRVEVETKESYRASLRLIRAGLLAGPSSGFALVGLTRFLESSRQDPARWEGLRNGSGDIVASFICGDTPHLYIDKYSTILDAADFAL
ncbi:MAG: pyridoxal-phosphate dependent enzyme [Geothrix sp.]|nr:pyridoxal-phosphate dependent enzyme [Geothrix sp.]